MRKIVRMTGLLTSCIASMFYAVPAATAGSKNSVQVRSTANPGVIALQIGQMQMTTANVGWALGQSASSTASDPHPLILRTSDGGLSWTNVMPQGIAFDKATLCAGFAGPLSAAIVNLGTSRSLRVYVTVDGGRTWTTSQPIRTLYGDGLLNIQYVNRQYGFVEVSDAGNGTLEGDMFATRDGGQTWTRTATSGSMKVGSKHWLPYAEGFSFRTPEDGWMGGEQRAGGELGGPGFLWLFHSIDGGVSWRQASLPIPRGWSKAATNVSEPQWFGSLGHLFVQFWSTTSSAQTTYLYTTTDSGAHWSLRRVPANSSVSWPPAYFVDAKTGFDLAAGRLLRTDDGGVHWTAIKANSPWTAESVQFADAKTGWFSGEDRNGTYWERTTDGGVTWTKYVPMLQPSHQG